MTQAMVIRCLVAATLAAALTFAPHTAPVRAQGVVGTGTPGSCTEAAFNAALATGGGVSFNCGAGVHTIQITLAKEITVPTLIDGENKIILDALDGNRVFNVYTGLTLRNIRLTRGYVAGSDGGAILHLATAAEEALVLENTEIFASESTDNGGAIATYGTTTLTDSHLEGNEAPNGGAIFARGESARVSLYNSSLYDNEATGSGGDAGLGGAILAVEGAFVYLEAGRIELNHARDGGGLYLAPTTSLVTYEQASIAFNVATNTNEETNDGYGGGIYAADNTQLELTDTILSSNQATHEGGLGGGGLFNDGLATLVRVTLNDNIAVGDGGGMYNGGTAILSNVSLARNVARTGGGVRNRGTLTMTTSTFSNNSAIYGGGLDTGIYAENTPASLTNVNFNHNAATGDGGAVRNTNLLTLNGGLLFNNTAEGNGGGVVNGDDSTALLTAVTFAANIADGNGGGLANRDGNVVLTNVTLSENEAGDSGGGLVNAGLTELLGVTLSGNSAQRGGGVYNDGSSTVTIDNSTLSGNSADLGGGLYNFEGLSNLTHVTVAGNTAINGGGGLYLDGGTVTAKNSIVTDNSSPSGRNCSDTPTNNGFNLADDTTCGFTLVSSMELGPLTFNGGPTQTHLPLLGSPAINYVASGCPPPAVDQRGAARPVGGKCDAGAVEAGAILPMLYLPLVVKN